MKRSMVGCLLMVGLFQFGCSGGVESGPSDLVAPFRCFHHEECESGVCHLGWEFVQDPALPVNTCVPTQKLTHVDLDRCDSTTQAEAGTGSAQKPFCQVQDALKKGPLKRAPLILVKPASAIYDAVTVDAGKTVVIVGAGRNALLPLSAQNPTQKTTTIEKISVSGLWTVARLYGVTLNPKGFTANRNAEQPDKPVGLSCQNRAKVSLYKSVVQGYELGVLFDDKCENLLVEASYIGYNHGHGIRLNTPPLGSPGHFQITSSVIARNGGVGVFVGSIYGIFSFNTVVENGYNFADRKTISVYNETEKGGAIVCSPDAIAGVLDGSMARIENSILAGNKLGNDKTQIGVGLPGTPTCKLLNSILSIQDGFVGSNGSGILKRDVLFIGRTINLPGNFKRTNEDLNDPDPTDWRLQSQEYDAVRDQASLFPVSEDYFGNVRPRYPIFRTVNGSGFDIGHQQI